MHNIFFPSSLFFSLIMVYILSTLRIPLEVSGTHSVSYMQHRSKVLQHKLPIPRCSLSSICPIILWLRLFNYSSFLDINPSHIFLQWSSQLINEIISVAEFINNKLSSLKATTTIKSHPGKNPPSFFLHTPFYACLLPSIS
jgi:hypothetical protein